MRHTARSAHFGNAGVSVFMAKTEAKDKEDVDETVRFYSLMEEDFSLLNGE